MVAWLKRWLGRWFRPADRPGPRLALVERIALAPRQALVLVEAEGRRFLVATSAEGSAVFYPLDEAGRAAGRQPRGLRRVTW